MLNLEWKNKIRQHGISIGGSKPTMKGAEYSLKIESGEAVEEQVIIVPWLKVLGFESAVFEHNSINTIRNTFVDLAQEKGGYDSLSDEHLGYLDQIHETEIDTNSSLPESIQSDHEYPLKSDINSNL